MKYIQQGNCPYCDGENGDPTAWGMSPEELGRLKKQHDAGHPEHPTEKFTCNHLFEFSHFYHEHTSSGVTANISCRIGVPFCSKCGVIIEQKMI